MHANVALYGLEQLTGIETHPVLEDYADLLDVGDLTNRCCNTGAATMGSMALIVFFRGINVGGHRAFRPSVLAKELGIYDAVNVGAAGTLVVRKPGLRAKFLAELRRKLPFEATIAFCDGSDLIRLEMDNPFGTEPPLADVVQFVSILAEAGRRRVSLPIALPEGGEWLVRIIGSKNRLVYGVYRRHMKTIGYLGQIDRLFGAPATTRSWNTILSVLRILKSERARQVAPPSRERG
jgi:uncharacterized protein (DUF1697 family)